MTEVCDAAVERACAAGVSGVLLAGVDAPGWRDAAQLQARIGRRMDVALAYGVHPQVVSALAAQPASVSGAGSMLDEQLQALARAARGEPLFAGGPALPRPHAIGELGLHGVEPGEAAAEAQERAFRAQLALARELELPLVLHIVRAHGPALRMLHGDGVPRAGGVVHSYSGSAELVEDYLRLGLCLSFAGPVTRPDARRVQAAAQRVPMARLLVETDAPDQTPWSRCPAACEPAFLSDIIEALALHRGESGPALALATEQNARRLFGLANNSISDPAPSHPPGRAPWSP